MKAANGGHTARDQPWLTAQRCFPFVHDANKIVLIVVYLAVTVEHHLEMARVNGGRIPGQRGGVKAGQWLGRMICKGPDGALCKL